MIYKLFEKVNSPEIPTNIHLTKFDDISEQSHEDYAGDDAAAVADYTSAKLEEF